MSVVHCLKLNILLYFLFSPVQEASSQWSFQSKPKYENLNIKVTLLMMILHLLLNFRSFNIFVSGVMNDNPIYEPTNNMSIYKIRAHDICPYFLYKSTRSP